MCSPRQDEERFTVIKNVRAPYGEVGKLETAWSPLILDADGRPVDPDGGDCDAELPDIDSPKVCVHSSRTRVKS